MHESASSFDPLRSTYLDLRLSHILWKVADDDLAVPGSLAGECGCGDGCLGDGFVLLNAAGWCSDRGLGLGFGVAGWARAATADTCWLAGVLHDLVERLVELSRHGECSGGCVFIRWRYVCE